MNDNFSERSAHRRDSDGGNAGDEPYNFEGGRDRNLDSIMHDVFDRYDFQPTVFNPAKTERMRLESIVMTAALLIVVVFGIAAVASNTVTYYKKEKGSVVELQVSTTSVHGCIDVGNGKECQRNSIMEAFCSPFRSRVAGYLGTQIVAILIAFIAFIFSCCVLGGRMCLSKYLVLVLAILTWIFMLTALICCSVLLTSKLCNNESLKSVGFKYGPALPLTATSFSLLTVALIFYVVWRKLRPVKYRY